MSDFPTGAARGEVVVRGEGVAAADACRESAGRHQVEDLGRAAEEFLPGGDVVEKTRSGQKFTPAGRTST
jgi:hypothetical protein